MYENSFEFLVKEVQATPKTIQPIVVVFSCLPESMLSPLLKTPYTLGIEFGVIELDLTKKPLH